MNPEHTTDGVPDDDRDGGQKKKTCTGASVRSVENQVRAPTVVVECAGGATVAQAMCGEDNVEQPGDAGDDQNSVDGVVPVDLEHGWQMIVQVVAQLQQVLVTNSDYCLAGVEVGLENDLKVAILVFPNQLFQQC